MDSNGGCKSKAWSWWVVVSSRYDVDGGDWWGGGALNVVETAWKNLPECILQTLVD